MFNLFDRVVYVSDRECDNKKLTGLTGVVVSNPGNRPAVEFDCHINGHNAGGAGKDGHCWYVPADRLELAWDYDDGLEMPDVTEEELCGFLFSE